MSLLTVKDLRVSFQTRNGKQEAVKGVSFELNEGEILGIVGESGSGKSVTCYSLLGLIPMPPGVIESGEALYDGQDLLKLNEKALRQLRGRKINMIFQDPMTALNPYMTVAKQIIEANGNSHKASNLTYSIALAFNIDKSRNRFRCEGNTNSGVTNVLNNT